MNRPTFVTMSTLVFSLVAYVTLAHTAHAGNTWMPTEAIDSRDGPPSGAYPRALRAAYNHGNAACLTTAPVH